MKLLGLYALIAAAAAANPPASSYFDICKRSDRNINDCIKRSIMKSKPKLIKGIPELDVVPLEPLNIPLMDMSQSGLHFTLKNITVTGLKLFNVEDVRYDNLKLNITMRTPHIKIAGKYEMDGKIIVLPVSGKGNATLNFTDVMTKGISEMETYKNKENTYIRIKSMVWEIEPKHAQSYFTNLLTSDKTLGDAINAVLNNNWKELYVTYKQLPEQAFGQIFREIGNRILKNYTYDEWFPE